MHATELCIDITDKKALNMIISFTHQHEQTAAQEFQKGT